MLVKAGIAAAVLVNVASAQVAVYGQCGGMGYTGNTNCASGSACSTLNPYYAQCLPGGPTATTTRAGATTTTPVRVTTTPARGTTLTTTTRATTTSAAAISCSSNSPPSSAGSVQFGGVNLSGYDFGCLTDGSCSGKNVPPPTSQIQHFQQVDKFNTFRIPIGWQQVMSSPGGSLGVQWSSYQQTVNTCLQSGAYCIIDIHNYARYNGAIIGQGGPTDAQFADLWSKIASAFANQPKVIFGVMNEPHDVNIQTWANTVQKVVTAIRNAGAKTQMILLPGNNYTSASTFVSSGSADALNAVTNPDGSKTGLIMDVHKYLDSDNSGTHTECVKDNVDDGFRPLSYWLRCHGRQALLSETGGGNTQSCVQYLGQQLTFLNQNSDVFLGFVGWAAGSFDGTYELVETPNSDGSDRLLVSQVLRPQFHP